MSVRNQRSSYGTMPYTPLLPWQVRERRFKLVGLGRRGLEPDHVYAFLDRVAVDMAAVYAALAASRREVASAKEALRRQSSDHADQGPEA
ncbi:DivIVA domain-containing protein [Micromonospora sp. 4G55]|uniref:DivIVA domain-containing protein n=1 Tax=Micromonospora sp. 4G55 TaxID=2806102 RepID=UPI001A4F978F|nr:DivIVA domain-containing protein [Micromonospora sp. 4G55]MBM0255702.1 DivIVA domain-containing protein [Micromonospora sp. 4G55]